MSYYGPNRYVCTVLEEMRNQLKALDRINIDRYISMTRLMIEEVQTHVNNMETAIADWSDFERMHKDKKKLKKEIKKLRAQKDKLTEDKDD